MNTLKTHHFQHARLTLIAAGIAVGSAAFAATMDRADYASTKTQINTTYKSEKSACGQSSGNQKDICMETAKGKEKVALAELDYRNTGKADDGNKVAVTKADAAYAVAKEMCDDKAGNAKDVCVKEAKAVHTKSRADTKLHMKVGEARMDAAEDKRDADYKVAAEKCESLAGDAKSACMSNAKARFGKI